MRVTVNEYDNEYFSACDSSPSEYNEHFSERDSVSMTVSTAVRVTVRECDSEYSSARDRSPRCN